MNEIGFNKNNFEEKGEAHEAGLVEHFAYWQHRAETENQTKQVEQTWARIFRLKHDALREVGFGRIASFIMVLKLIK